MSPKYLCKHARFFTQKLYIFVYTNNNRYDSSLIAQPHLRNALYYLLIPQTLQTRLIVRPTATHLNKHLQKHFTAKQLLHVLARFGSDAFHALAALPNDHGFVRVALNQYGGCDAVEVFFFGE